MPQTSVQLPRWAKTWSGPRPHSWQRIGIAYRHMPRMQAAWNHGRANSSMHTALDRASQSTSLRQWAGCTLPRWYHHGPATSPAGSHWLPVFQSRNDPSPRRNGLTWLAARYSPDSDSDHYPDRYPDCALRRPRPAGDSSGLPP